MKRRIFAIKRLTFVCMTLILMVSLTACYQKREKKYYSNKENFIIDVAVVKNIIYDEETNVLYFWLSEIDERYQDNTFKIEGESVSVVLKNDIFEKIQVGNEMEYISAPEYFGDGYCMPIVAISVNGEEVLGFDEGYDNLMEMY